MTTYVALRERLRLPLIAAPMFRVSGVDLVVAACLNGVIGAFPTANCRSVEELDAWLFSIRAAPLVAPWCANLIVHRSNPRMQDDLAVLLRHAPEIVITSVGSPAGVVAPLHDVGALVFSDVASIRHAERAIEAGADGLILLTAGAGGQTGWLNPFAFVRAVRRFFDGPLVLAGGIADGQALAAALALGCDLGYMGTRFIATTESRAQPDYKQMLVDSSADDVLLTRAFTGLQTNMLVPSIVAAGLDPANLPEHGGIDVAKDISADQPRRWRDIWSAGHSVSSVNDVVPASALIQAVTAEYEAASGRFNRLARGPDQDRAVTDTATCGAVTA